MKTDGKEVVVEQGGVVAMSTEDTGKSIKRTGKTSFTGSGQVTLPANTVSCGDVGGVGGGVSLGSMVTVGVHQSSKSQLIKSGKGVLQVTGATQSCEYYYYG